MNPPFLLPLDALAERLRAALPAAQAEAWAAIQNRDPRYAQAFVYGVTTTHIYCLSTCPARRPRRDRVVFFADPDEAQQAGMRACKRCRPGGIGTTRAVITRARAFLDAHPDTPVTLKTLAAHAGMSPSHLQRAFKRLVGVSPHAYQQAEKLRRFKTAVRGNDTVLGAAYAAGYGSSRGLYAQAGAGLGMTPATYRRGGAGLCISYALLSCSLGRLLVAATEKGVCAVALGDEDALLLDGLRAEFPQATLQAAPHAIESWAAPILRYLEGEGVHPEVPVDVQGTDFQRRVWQALREIPLGETRTYSELAASIGQPAATRAVAQACASNRVGLVVPCHRIVQKSGAAGGYRWGPERKAALLTLEKAAAAKDRR